MEASLHEAEEVGDTVVPEVDVPSWATTTVVADVRRRTQRFDIGPMRVLRSTAPTSASFVMLSGSSPPHPGHS